MILLRLYFSLTFISPFGQSLCWFRHKNNRSSENCSGRVTLIKLPQQAER
jgi:hypothetical protein